MSKSIFSFSDFLPPFIASVIAFLLISFAPTNIIERRFLDLSFQIRGSEQPHPDIVVIEIDDVSLAKVGTWPWPRSYHAALLKALSDFKPSVIFYDMIFSEESTKEEDLSFAQEIEKAGNVVLPFYFATQNPKNFQKNPMILPIPLFRDKAEALGFVNVFPDSDGHIREIYLTASSSEKRFLHTSLALASTHKRYNQLDLKSFESEKPILINFPGPYENFQRIPFDQFIAAHERTSKGMIQSLKDRVVLVGLTASGTVDLKPTAFSSLYPGIGVQASMVHTILGHKFIQKIPALFHFVLLFLFSLLIFRLSSVASPHRAFLYVAATLVLVFESIQLAFQYFYLWIPYFGFLALGSALYVIKTLTQFIKTRYETELMSRELTLAARIQQSFLPANIPIIPGLDVAAITLPARQVGGDLYDILPLDNGRWGICVGDVSGKGVPAALFMAKAISEFRREANAETPSSVMQKLNAKISTEGPSGLFLTFLYLILEPQRKRFVFSNGGHEPILFYQSKKNTIELLSTQEGVPLGVASDMNFDEKDQMGENGDILLLMSDGVKEAMNNKGEIFGFERIKSALLESAHGGDSRSLIDNLLRHIREFVKNSPQHDDITLVCVKFK